jgi:hypothetical protein
VIGTLTSVWTRVFAVLGRVSMYRLALLSLAALALVALGASFFGLVGPTPGELLATAALLAVVCVAADAAAQAVLRLPWRLESSLITAGILLFILRPTLEPAGLAGIALAGAVASLSKYVLAWRGRHIFNPAAVGATVLTLVSIVAPDLGASAWWVGTPVLAVPVVVLGLLVLIRTEKVRVIAVFLVIAVAVGVARTATQYQGRASPSTTSTSSGRCSGPRRSCSSARSCCRSPSPCPRGAGSSSPWRPWSACSPGGR